jgi:carboxypeptidase family protein
MPRLQLLGASAVLVGVLALPAVGSAQQASGIAGVVRDTTGAVLPGVTVEAASPALIEKARSAITDNAGRYNIVDLRPGTYLVTFTLAGFNTIRREGVELTSGFTATVNADMRVGALEETVTVTGASPLVDVQNTRRQTVLSDELLATLPTGTQGLATLITVTPGLTGAADVGGSAGAYRTMGTPQSLAYHGRSGMKVTYDGMAILNMAGDGNVSYIINSQTIEEMVLESGGISAESASSGFSANGVPKEGSNTFSFSVSGLFTNDKLQSDNLSDDLRARGVTTTDKTLHVYDAGVTLGGPIRKDKLWFYGAIRWQGSKNQKAGIFHNKTQGTPFFTPDTDRPADRREYDRFYAARVTWQASARNKVNFFTDLQNVCRCVYEGFEAPEAAFGLHFWPQQLTQVTWSSPRTNRLLLEAGASAVISDWADVVQPGTSREHISILELSTGFPYNANAWRGPGGFLSHIDDDHYAQRFSASYVTGSHAFKAGVQVEEGTYNQREDIDRKVGFQGETLGNVSYRFLQGVPNGLTEYAAPYFRQERVKADLGLFVQDRWTLKRLTLNYGVRFDYFNGSVPGQHAPAGQYVPERNFAAVHDVPAWSDVNPRVGVAYDLSGDGRTALKVAIGRYVGKTATTVTGANNPIQTSVIQVNRTWNDTNGNYSPDCDLRNPAANGECGTLEDQNFGNNNPRATRYADDVLRGFGVRDSSWDLTTEVQHQFGPGVSLTGGYYRSWQDNFRVTDNLEVTPEDFSPFCITAPVDPRLPGGGSNQICGLYDIAPAKFGRVSNLVGQASRYGKQTRASDFFGLTFNTRIGSGIQFGGGVDTGRSVEDLCFIVDSPGATISATGTFVGPFAATTINGRSLCRTVTPFSAQTQVKLFGTLPLPGRFVASGTFQNVAGPPYQANYQATNAEIAPSLGRNLAACGTRVVCTATAMVPLIAPQTQFEDRRTQLDLRLSRLFRLGATVRAQANFDVYNVFNASSILGLNNTYGRQWRVPVTSIAIGSGVLNGRLFQFSGRVSF